jgi:hypothetical protein
LDFQVLARFMVGMNLFLPIFSFLVVFTDNPASRNICLGEGYHNFFSTKAQFCSYDDPYINGICWVWLVILMIGNSKFQINEMSRINVCMEKLMKI